MPLCSSVPEPANGGTEGIQKSLCMFFDTLKLSTIMTHQYDAPQQKEYSNIDSFENDPHWISNNNHLQSSQ